MTIVPQTNDVFIMQETGHRGILRRIRCNGRRKGSIRTVIETEMTGCVTLVTTRGRIWTGWAALS